MGFEQEVEPLYAQIRAACPADADGVLIAGTGFRCVAILEALEQDLKRPVDLGEPGEPLALPAIGRRAYAGRRATAACSGCDDPLSPVRQDRRRQIHARQSTGGATGTVLISEVHWNATLFPDELKSIDDYRRYSARVRAVLGPHVVALRRPACRCCSMFRPTPRPFAAGCGR